MKSILPSDYLGYQAGSIYWRRYASDAGDGREGESEAGPLTSENNCSPVSVMQKTAEQIPPVTTHEELRQEEAIQKRAKRNQTSSGEHFGKGMQKTAEPIKTVTTREELAKLAGVSRDTVAKVKVIEVAATAKQKAELSAGTKMTGDCILTTPIADSDGNF